MALTVGNKYLASEFISLKARVKAEMQRRKYTGPLTTYAGSSYDYTVTPTAGNVVRPEHYNKIITPLNAINSTGFSTVSSGNVIKAINSLKTFLEKAEGYSLGSTTTDCKSSCSGLCVTGCGNTCKGCSGTCKGGCGGTCSGCSGCSATCKSSCATDNCDSGCWASCSSTCYSSSCKGECQGGCITSCKGGCTGCSTTCTGTCKNACQGSCKGAVSSSPT